MKRLAMIVMMMMFPACMLPTEPTAEVSEEVLSGATESGFPYGYPSCKSLGCPLKPSGSPEIWEPCTVNLPCYCQNPAVMCYQTNSTLP